MGILTNVLRFEFYDDENKLVGSYILKSDGWFYKDIKIGENRLQSIDKLSNELMLIAIVEYTLNGCKIKSIIQ